MQRGQRHLRGSHQVEVVLGQAVDLLLGVGQEAGAEEGPLTHQDGRDHRLESRRLEPLDSVAHQGQLQEHQLTAQVGEPGPRELGGVLHVDPAACQLQVVPARGACLPHLLENRVLRWRVLGRQVGQ